MSEFDTLRQMFEDFAGDPPLALGRKEAVMSRISRRLQRQAAVRGVAGFAVVALLGVGAVTTTQHLTQTGSDRTDIVQTEPSHSASPSSEPSREPSHEPSHEPSKAPTTEPTHPPAPVGVEPTHAPSHEPTTKPAPENTAASGPLTVSVTMSPSTVATSATAHALVTARDGEGRLLDVDITWGDDKTFHFSPGDASCPRTTHLDGDFTHQYAAPGTYTVHVTITTGDCAAQEKVTREAHVTVTGSDASPSPTCTNGPSAPVAGGSTYAGDNAAYTYVHATGSDSDGIVHLITVNWGDGSSTVVVGEWSTGSSHDGNVNHSYANPGTYTVTVTVTSRDCNGNNTQTNSKQFDVTKQA